MIVDELEKLKQKAYSGDPEAIGEMYEQCLANNDKKGAKYWLDLALFNHYGVGYRKMGYAYENGIGVVADINKSKEYYLLGSEKNDVQSRYNLALIYLKEDNDMEKSKELLKLNVPYNHVNSIKLLTYLSEKSSVSRSEYLEMLHSLGDPKATYLIAQSLLSGDNLSKDYKKAFQLLMDAYSKNADIFYLLGCCYLNGWGIEKNYNQALYFFMEASKFNHPASSYQISIMYKNGWGVYKDPQLEKFYLDKAISAGYKI